MIWYAGHSYKMGTVMAQAVAAPEAEQVEQAISSDIHGFELQRQQWVAEYNSTVLLYKHKKTGLLIRIFLHPQTCVYLCFYMAHTCCESASVASCSLQRLNMHMAFEQISCHGTELHQEAKHAEWHRCGGTGAQVMSLLNKDENKTFGAVFRTPVENSKGIPHILEHSVLCGSKKYPIKEPFVELMKGSLNTFLNAFTYPDRTCYPVASTNLQVRMSSTCPHLSLVYLSVLVPSTCPCKY